MDVRSIAERVLALPLVRFVMAVLDTYGKAPGGILANGLAFAALFSALPTTLLLLGIGGLVAQDPAFQAKLATALAEAFPPLAGPVRRSPRRRVAGRRDRVDPRLARPAVGRQPVLQHP